MQNTQNDNSGTYQSLEFPEAQGFPCSICKYTNLEHLMEAWPSGLSRTHTHPFLKTSSSRRPASVFRKVARNSKEQTKLKWDKPVSANICGFLQESAVFCENLCFRDAVIPRKSKSLQKSAKKMRIWLRLSLLVCPFQFPLKKRPGEEEPEYGERAD